jgi:hypothetical protein
MFIAFKRADADKYLSAEQITALAKIMWTIERGRDADGKTPFNKYLVCNQDEPYADKVLQAILAGEDAKMEAQNAG